MCPSLFNVDKTRGIKFFSTFLLFSLIFYVFSLILSHFFQFIFPIFFLRRGLRSTVKLLAPLPLEWPLNGCPLRHTKMMCMLASFSWAQMECCHENRTSVQRETTSNPRNVNENGRFDHSEKNMHCWQRIPRQHQGNLHYIEIKTTHENHIQHALKPCGK